MDNNGDFKVRYIHQLSITIRIQMQTMQTLLDPWALPMSRIWCVGCLQINPGRICWPLQRHLLKFERANEVSYIPICIWLTSFTLIFLFHVCLLRWNFGELKCVECMSLIVVGRSMQIMDHFCPRVDVVPKYSVILGGSMSQSSTISHTRLLLSGEDFGRNRSRS